VSLGESYWHLSLFLFSCLICLRLPHILYRWRSKYGETLARVAFCTQTPAELCGPRLQANVVSMSQMSRESPGIQLHLKWTCFAHVSVETVFYHVLPCCTCALHGFVSTVLRKNCSQNAGNTMVSPMEIMQPFFNHTRLEIGKLMKIAHQQPKQCVPQAPLEFGNCLGPNWIWVVSKRPGTAGRLWYPQTWAAGFAIVEACCGGMWNRFLVIKIWMSESGSLR